VMVKRQQVTHSWAVYHIKGTPAKLVGIIDNAPDEQSAIAPNHRSWAGDAPKHSLTGYATPGLVLSLCLKTIPHLERPASAGFFLLQLLCGIGRTWRGGFAPAARPR
jgi:hypothetical protein